MLTSTHFDEMVLRCALKPLRTLVFDLEILNLKTAVYSISNKLHLLESFILLMQQLHNFVVNPLEQRGIRGLAH